MSMRTDGPAPQNPSPGWTGEWRLQLLGSFALRAPSWADEVPSRAQRLLALLAVSGRRLTRGFVAGRLWPDVAADRANASLRTTLWGFSRWPDTPVRVDGTVLSLDARVTVDLNEASGFASALVDPGTSMAGSPGPATDRDDLHLLVHDLLPGWSDEWLVVDREQFRQLRLHALEELARHRAGARRYAQAIAAAMAAVSAEPLRESAHRLLMQIYLEEGNRCEALRQYHVYARLSRTEMGVGPTDAMESLFASALAEADHTGRRARPARAASRAPGLAWPRPVTPR